MKQTLLIFVFIPLFLLADKLSAYSKLKEICFTENAGQIGDQFGKPRPDILFGGSAHGMAFHIRKNGISYQLYKTDTPEDFDLMRDSKKLPVGITTIYRLDINLVNCNERSEIITDKECEGYSNYYSSICPNGAMKVHSYEAICFKNIYKGIHLKWYSNNGELKYDYICSAGADYKQICLQIEGAEKINVNDKGELEYRTPLGIIVEQSPKVFQNGKLLRSKWILRDNVVTIDIENLSEELPFVIDPVTRPWATYYGDSGNEVANSCSTDALNNVYMAGSTGTNPSTVIATAGAFQTTYSGGITDAFLVKFNGAGVRQWATYYGGFGTDGANSCCCDLNGNVYLAGYTDTSSGMATIGAHQYLSGGGQDAFLVKFDSNGLRLWATYYGGANSDLGCICMTDTNGNVYMAGETSSDTGTVISTAGAHQSAFGGATDGFLVKFSSSGSRLWGTYYGGAGGERIYYACNDPGGMLYLCGRTTSPTTTLIATPGSYQTNSGGQEDAFLAKFTPNGGRLWGTYYGDTGLDEGWCCTSDASGNVYMSGRAGPSSGTVMATPGAFQPIYGNSQMEGFAAKFDSNGVRQWGTFYGDCGEIVTACKVSGSGYLYLFGTTCYTTNIATPGSYQPNSGGFYDAFIAKFNLSGQRGWGSYYGGVGADRGWAVAIDQSDALYIAGQTAAPGSTVLATAGAYQSVNSGGSDAFLAKFDDCSISDPTNATPAVNQMICEGTSATLFATGNGIINWYPGPTSTVSLGTGTIFLTSTLSAGVYTFYAEDSTCWQPLVRTAISVTVSVCTSLNEIKNLNQFSVFPNPSNGNISVSQEKAEELTIEVYSSAGTLVFEEVTRETKTNIPIPNAAAGIYIVKLRSESRCETINILKN